MGISFLAEPRLTIACNSVPAKPPALGDGNVVCAVTMQQILHFSLFAVLLADTAEVPTLVSNAKHLGATLNASLQLA